MIADAPSRTLCLRCRRAESACWCAHVPALSPRCRVILLQHPREAKNPIGTARMAHLALPGSELIVGVELAGDPRVQRLWQSEAAHSVVLYPAEGARPISELAAREGPLTIWMIDGTWWQAGKIWRKNPWLHTLPAYRIEPTAPSRYVIRAEPEAHCLSSVEAVAAALDASEGAPGRHAALIDPLLALVEQQLDHKRANRGVPPRRAPRPRPVHYVPPELRGREADALIVHGEGNAWPARFTNRPPTELAQWLATRPATGERFSVIVAQKTALTEHTHQHLRLTTHDFAGAVSHGELHARWQAFVRTSDVWCAWGHVPQTLLASTGLAPPRIVDLRAWTHRTLRAHPGRIEIAHPLLANHARTPTDPGRGGERITLLEAIFERLIDPARAG